MAFGEKMRVPELHTVLLEALDGHITKHSSIEEKPLAIELKEIPSLVFEIYLFNITNPPGARQAGECKSQLIFPGQKRGTRWEFNHQLNKVTILAGFAQMLGDIDTGAFVFWELAKHEKPAYSANIQVSLDTLLETLSNPVFRKKKRGNGEWEIVCRRDKAFDGLLLRRETDRNIMLGVAMENGTH